MGEKAAFLLEKIALAHKNLLWQIAKEENLTPTQIEIIFLVATSKPEKALTTIIAKGLGLTKPTVSESIKSLKRKGVLTTMPLGDKRKLAILLTPKGKKIYQKLTRVSQVTKNFFKTVDKNDRFIVLQVLLDFLRYLKKKKLIHLLRICQFCDNLKYDKEKNKFYCSMTSQEITIDSFHLNCPEFREAGR